MRQCHVLVGSTHPSCTGVTIGEGVVTTRRPLRLAYVKHDDETAHYPRTVATSLAEVKCTTHIDRQPR
jgi:hypothetical protein